MNQIKNARFSSYVNFTASIKSIAAILLLALSGFGCGYTGFASLSDGGEQAELDSFSPSVSASGQYVAFDTASDNLVPGSAGGWHNIYVRDMAADTIYIASITPDQMAANGGSFASSLSRSGRYVAFESDASNLVSNDTNGQRDIFLHDTTTGGTQRLNQYGFLPVVQANGYSGSVDITCVATCIAVFESDATNLVSNDFNGESDIFRSVAGGIDRISVDKDGNDADGESSFPAASQGGGIIAFESEATNLLQAGTDTNGFEDIYVRNTALDQNTRVSVNWLGGGANNASRNPDVDASGRYVVFESFASDLIFGDTNATSSIYLRDRFSFFTEKISVSTSGQAGNAESTDPEISDDGRYVVFRSSATNLVPDDINGESDVFVRDRWQDTTTRLSVDTFGVEGNERSRHPAISGDGRYVAFSSSANNLVPDDSNDLVIAGIVFRSHDDIVMRFVPDVTVTGMVPSNLFAGVTTSVTVSGTNFIGIAVGDISGDDDTISNLVLVDENTITMDVTLPANAAPGGRTVSVLLAGTGPGIAKGGLGVCLNCATVVAAP